jgi:uncharacterized protein (TIGR02246 family)
MNEKTPLQVIQELDEAFNCGDIDSILNFYEDDATIVIEPGRLATGKPELRRSFEWMFNNITGVAKQEKTHVIENGDLALFTSRWSLTGSTGEGTSIARESIATVILRKHPERGWRIVVDNSWGPAVLD